MRTEFIQQAKATAQAIMTTATVDELRDYASEGENTQEEAITRVAAKRELLKRGVSVSEYSR